MSSYTIHFFLIWALELVHDGRFNDFLSSLQAFSESKLPVQDSPAMRAIVIEKFYQEARQKQCEMGRGIVLRNVVYRIESIASQRTFCRLHLSCTYV